MVAVCFRVGSRTETSPYCGMAGAAGRGRKSHRLRPPLLASSLASIEAPSSRSFSYSLCKVMVDESGIPLLPSAVIPARRPMPRIGRNPVQRRRLLSNARGADTSAAQRSQFIDADAALLGEVQQSGVGQNGATVSMHTARSRARVRAVPRADAREPKTGAAEARAPSPCRRPGLSGRLLSVPDGEHGEKSLRWHWRRFRAGGRRSPMARAATISAYQCLAEVRCENIHR